MLTVYPCWIGLAQNPAVSLGLFLVGGITPVRMVILIISQVLGGIAGSALVQGLLGNMYARTTLRPGLGIARGLFLEMFLTVSRHGLVARGNYRLTIQTSFCSQSMLMLTILVRPKPASRPPHVHNP